MVAQGLSLVVDSQNCPEFDVSWLPGELRWSDSDSGFVRLDISDPILKGLPSELRGKRVVIDAFDGGDAGWRFLGDPKGIAIRKHGKGYIILCQVGMPATLWDGSPAVFVENLFRFAAHGRLDKPTLVLDPGTGATSASGPIIEPVSALNLPFVQCDY